jgi:hypothetical protein
LNGLMGLIVWFSINDPDCALAGYVLTGIVFSIGCCCGVAKLVIALKRLGHRVTRYVVSKVMSLV